MTAIEAYKSKMEFYKTTGRKEQEELDLGDIMVILNWNYTPFAKIDEDLVSEICLSSFSY